MKCKYVGIALLAGALVVSFSACGQEKNDASATEAVTEAVSGQTAAAKESEAADTYEKEELPYVSAFDFEDITEYVKLADYSSLEIERADCTVTDADVDEEILSRLSSNAVYQHITEGVCKEGDTVNIDFVGKLDGVEFEGGSDTNKNLTLGSDAFVEGFEDALVGAEAGKTTTIEVTFPEDYGVDSLNGQKVQFDVTVNYICGDRIESLEALDDAAAADLAALKQEIYDTVEGLRAYLLDEYLPDYKNALADDEMFDKGWEYLKENSEFLKEPEEMIAQIYQDKHDDMLEQLEYYGMDMESYCEQFETTEEDVWAGAMEEAKDEAKDRLLFCALAKAEGVAYTEEELETQLTYLADQYGTDVDTLLAYYGVQKEYLEDYYQWSNARRHFIEVLNNQ